MMIKNEKWKKWKNGSICDEYYSHCSSDFNILNKIQLKWYNKNIKNDNNRFKNVISNKDKDIYLKWGFENERHINYYYHLKAIEFIKDGLNDNVILSGGIKEYTYVRINDEKK